MKITIFAKRQQTKGENPRTFYNYLSTLVSRDGFETPVQVKFRDEAGQPKPEKCPINIIVDKGDANLVKRQYTIEETGEIRTAHTLWVAKWVEGEPYVDHSLDDYD